MRALVKDRGLWGYFRLRKADLISLLRFHDAITPKSMEGGVQKQFDSEESDHKDKLDYPSA